MHPVFGLPWVNVTVRPAIGVVAVRALATVTVPAPSGTVTVEPALAAERRSGAICEAGVWVQVPSRRV